MRFRTKTILFIPLALLTLAVSVRCGDTPTKTTVPNVSGQYIEVAYNHLRRADLRVSTVGPLSFEHRLYFPPPPGSPSELRLPSSTVQSQVPSAHRTVSTKSTVVLSSPGALVSIPGSLDCSPPPSTVPRFVGHTLSWVVAHDNCFSMKANVLPRLHFADQPDLLDNYVITKQSPVAGASISSNGIPFVTLIVIVRK